MSSIVPPSPDQILAAREAAGLTQAQAAAVVLTPRRTWQDWERGVARMHPGLWELFRLKALHTLTPAA